MTMFSPTVVVSSQGYFSWNSMIHTVWSSYYLSERTKISFRFSKVETTTLKFRIQTFAISHIHRYRRVKSTFSFSIIRKPCQWTKKMVFKLCSGLFWNWPHSFFYDSIQIFEISNVFVRNIFQFFNFLQNVFLYIWIFRKFVNEKLKYRSSCLKTRQNEKNCVW